MQTEDSSRNTRQGRVHCRPKACQTPEEQLDTLKAKVSVDVAVCTSSVPTRHPPTSPTRHTQPYLRLSSSSAAARPWRRTPSRSSCISGPAAAWRCRCVTFPSFLQQVSSAAPPRSSSPYTRPPTAAPPRTTLPILHSPDHFAESLPFASVASSHTLTRTD